MFVLKKWLPESDDKVQLFWLHPIFAGVRTFVEELGRGSATASPSFACDQHEVDPDMLR